jgi:hypothetical protein
MVDDAWHQALALAAELTLDATIQDTTELMGNAHFQNPKV